MNILIAEDDDITRYFYRSVLEDWGYTPCIVENGEQALQLLSRPNAHFDLCLFDVEMPLMSGVEATRQLRKTLPHIPVVISSSDGSYRGQSISAGADLFCRKPLGKEALQSLIEWGRRKGEGEDGG